MLAEVELERRVKLVIGVLDGLNVAERLAILGGVSTALLVELPAEMRGGVADAWFEIIVSSLPKT